MQVRLQNCIQILPLNSTQSVPHAAAANHEWAKLHQQTNRHLHCEEQQCHRPAGPHCSQSRNGFTYAVVHIM
jgi:hypothetical protein